MNDDMNQHFPLATAGHRIGALAVDAGLSFVTFGIGWLVWNLITWADGQTPGKKILKVRVISKSSNKPANWGRMFVRQCIIPWLMSVFFLVPYYIWIFKGFPVDGNTIGLVSLGACFAIYALLMVLDLVWLFGSSHRRLIDYWANTYVINEANASKLLS